MLTQTDLQTIADLTAEFLGISIRPRIQVKETYRGRARIRTQSITVPTSALRVSDEFATYYTVHEICHFINGWIGGHGPFFKNQETKALAQWNLQPVYAKAYPKKLLNLCGQVVYDRKTEMAKAWKTRKTTIYSENYFGT